jgi:hypothetical protein
VEETGLREGWFFFLFKNHQNLVGIKLKKLWLTDMLGVGFYLAMLPPVYPDERDKLQLDVYLQGPEGAAEGGANDRVRELRMQRMCVL